MVAWERQDLEFLASCLPFPWALGFLHNGNLSAL